MKRLAFIIALFLSVACHAQEQGLSPFISFAAKHLRQVKEDLPGTFTIASGSLTFQEPKPNIYYYYPSDTSLLRLGGERFSFVIIMLDEKDTVKRFMLSKLFTQAATSAPDGIYPKEDQRKKAAAVYKKIKETLDTQLSQKGIEKQRKNKYLDNVLASWSYEGFTIDVSYVKPSKRKDKRYGGNIDITVYKGQGLAQ